MIAETVRLYDDPVAKEKRRPVGRPARSGKVASARFEIRLTGDEYTRWSKMAEKQNITLAELVRESVELAIARGGSR